MLTKLSGAIMSGAPIAISQSLLESAVEEYQYIQNNPQNIDLDPINLQTEHTKLSARKNEADQLLKFAKKTESISKLISKLFGTDFSGLDFEQVNISEQQATDRLRLIEDYIDLLDRYRELENQVPSSDISKEDLPEHPSESLGIELDTFLNQYREAFSSEYIIEEKFDNWTSDLEKIYPEDSSAYGDENFMTQKEFENTITQKQNDINIIPKDSISESKVSLTEDSPSLQKYVKATRVQRDACKHLVSSMSDNTYHLFLETARQYITVRGDLS